MHKSIQNTLSRRNVLKVAAVAPVAATPLASAAASPQGTSKHFGELFHDWQRAWLASGEAHRLEETPENVRIMDECCDTAHAAFLALMSEPAFRVQDLAAKVHGFRTHMNGCYPEEEYLEQLWQDIDRLAVMREV